MILKNLSVTNFRNIENIEFSPSEGINVFCGENGMGKTNLLESIWMLTGAKSFRKSKDKELVQFGKNSLKVSAEVNSGGVDKQIGYTVENRRTVFISDKPQRSPNELSQHFNATVFSPCDLELASEGPSVKRRFLDLTLSQLFPKYFSALKSYSRALEQRNAVLRDAKYNAGSFELLNSVEETLCESQKVITAYRERLTEKLTEIFPRLYSEISGDLEKAGLKYISTSGEDFKAELEKSRKTDMLSGNTSAGPHRDDIMLTLNGNLVRSFSSQGQKRSAALSLKLAEAEIIKSVKGEEPVILLDDVMSELDVLRQSRLISLLSSRQVFITCCDENNISSLKCGKVLKIKEGGVATCIST